MKILFVSLSDWALDLDDVPLAACTIACTTWLLE